MEWYYIYVLLSEKDGNFYTGYTNNLNNRINQHHKGYVTSTKNRRPLVLIYSESCLNQSDAIAREKYLKTGMGKRYLKNRVKNYLKNL